MQITTVDSNLIAEALCQIAEVHIKDKFLIDRKVLALIANLPQDEIKLKKLVISSERSILDEMNPTLLAKAVIKLETVCLLGSKISPLQENTFYRHIVQTNNLILKSLDVRRTSTSLNDVDGDLQAEAVIRLHEDKATVNEEQAKKILDLLHDIHDPKTKH